MQSAKNIFNLLLTQTPFDICAYIGHLIPFSCQGLHNLVQLLRGLLRHDQLLGVPRKHHQSSKLASYVPLLQPVALSGSDLALHGRHVSHGLANSYSDLFGKGLIGLFLKLEPMSHWQISFATFGLGSSSWLLVANWKKYPREFHWQRSFLVLATAVRLG